MRCNPSRWLWGLIPVAMLSWGTYYRERPNVEADLTVRATEALEAAGQSWAKVTMTGREAVITGRAQKDGDPKAALDIVRGVWGIRTVQLKTDLAGQPAPPERIGPQPDEAAIAAAKAKQEEDAAAALRAKEDAEAAARKAEEEAAAKARADAEAAALKAKEEAEAAAALKAKEEADAAAAQRAKEQTEAAMKAQADAEAALKAEEEAKAREAQEEADAAAAAHKAKEDAEAAAALKAQEAADAEAARKAEEDAAAAKAKEEAEAAAREAEALAAQKAKQDADMAAEAKADAEAKAAAEAEAQAKKAAEEDAKRAARKTTVETEACEKKLSAAVTEDVILFDRASAEIDRKSARTIKRLSEIIKACPGARVEVEGHTDSEGTDERNQSLSERRARAVVDSLVKAGVAEDRLSAVGYGASRPAAPNDTKTGMAKNRRIEFKVFTD
jgi:OOP family OmpA-OmpF porin